ncbi:unnamed protein product [Rotaria sordida]|uniref:Uncharacterized protein n=1 Tax=Rotaria sordida TaxID=392033 RepID=A0A819HCU9_9BILA|nr:unnamed protein product [Rotaria sordida]CAF1293045.1 unnamed protein product [Rotaria sordida]CAF3894980.1 unnamed protein product [Rotaria sordida]CAF3912721.1 unnamed protein product [Rotaria sordida]
MSGSTKHFVNMKINTRRIIVFGKSNDPDSQQVKQIFEQYFLPKDTYEWIDIEKRQDCKQIENYFRFLCFTDRRQTPYIFIDQLYFGSLFELNISHKNDSLKEILLK